MIFLILWKKRRNIADGGINLLIHNTFQFSFFFLLCLMKLCYLISDLSHQIIVLRSRTYVVRCWTPGFTWWFKLWSPWMEYTLERNDCDHATESYWAVLLDSVHTHPDIFESVTFSGFRIRLPSTRIAGLRHTNPKLLESALWVEICE